MTFVLTDVEGSTELWESDAEAMNIALQLHDECLRALLKVHYGHEVRGHLLLPHCGSSSKLAEQRWP